MREEKWFTTKKQRTVLEASCCLRGLLFGRMENGEGKWEKGDGKS
ncbi:hypothetical protein ACKUSY_03580 [Myroides odoratus]